MLKLLLAILLIPSVCLAASVDKSINGLITESSIASGDYIPFWDTSESKTRKMPMSSVFYAPSGVSIISSAYALSGSSVSIANSLYIASGATFYRSGGTATVYFYGDVQAGNYAWIDESSVSAYFMAGSVKSINPMWWEAMPNDSVDDTVAIRASMKAGYPYSSGTTYVVYSEPDVVFPYGHYYINAGVTPTMGDMRITSDGGAIIEQSTATQDIFDFNNCLRMRIENISFVGVGIRSPLVTPTMTHRNYTCLM